MLIVMPLEAYSEKMLTYRYIRVAFIDISSCKKYATKNHCSRPAPLLWRLVDLRVVLELGPFLLRLHLRQRRRQGRLAVVHVPDRAHVQVRLCRSRRFAAET